MLGRPSWLQKARTPGWTLLALRCWSLPWPEHSGTGTTSHWDCLGAGRGDGGHGHSRAVAGPGAEPDPVSPHLPTPSRCCGPGAAIGAGVFPGPQLQAVASPSLRCTLFLPPTSPGASLAQSQLWMLRLPLPWQPLSLPGCHGSSAPSRSRILSIERTQCVGSSGAATTGNATWGLGTEGQAQSPSPCSTREMWRCVLASPHLPGTVGAQALGSAGSLGGWWG